MSDKSGGDRPRVVRRRRRPGAKLLEEFPGLEAAIRQLPSNYNFEVLKSVSKCRELKARHVGLQMPEGLLMFACVLSDIFRSFGGEALEQVSVFGDVTYGACCIEDLGAKALGVDFLVHYGHSCLVPMQDVAVRVLYVFVEIRFDVDNAIESLHQTFARKDLSSVVPAWLSAKRAPLIQYEIGDEGESGHEQRPIKIAVLGTIQFAGAVTELAKRLREGGKLGSFPISEVDVPQALPLSGGETLGCTSPSLSSDTDVFVFLADGRFHLEAVMIANPQIPALRYDPYGKALTWEGYDHEKMAATRTAAIQRASTAQKWGIVLGTLGRQGNPAILRHVKRRLETMGLPSVTILLSEIFPSKLKLFTNVDAFVQIACPRLSIDWGHHFEKPVLNPYEFEVATGGCDWLETYPMDYYKKGSGPWSNYGHPNREVSTAAESR